MPVLWIVIVLMQTGSYFPFDADPEIRIRILTLVLQMSSPLSVVDCHLFDADPDPTFHFDADPEIRIRILTLVLQMMENLNFFFTLVNSSASLHCFVFHVRAIDVIIFNILDSAPYFIY